MTILHSKKHEWSKAARIVVVIFLGVIVAPVVANVASAAPTMVRPAVLAPLVPPPGATPAGSVPRSQSIGLEIVLAPSHEDQLTTLVRSLYDVNSSQYHHWVSAADFAKEFDPTPATISSVEEWLSSVGLRGSYQSGFAVHVSQPAGTVESGLGVAINDYRLAGGQEFHLANRAPLLSSAIAANVVSVLGLDDAPRIMSHLARDDRVSAASVLPHVADHASCIGVPTGVTTPDRVGAAYGIGGLISGGQTGAGEEVAVYELATHVASDVATYEQCFGLNNAVTTVPVDGGAGPAGPATDEADSDIEQVATQSPGASIVSYEGPNSSTGAFDTWNAIVQQDTASVVSTSYGLCEPDSSGAGMMSADEPLFLQAAVQGQTIVAASGDSGSEDCYVPSSGTDTSLQVDYPASSPYVTAVGGTTLATNGAQTAWNDCEGQIDAICASLGGGAGGGGVSRYFVRPTWQPVAWQWSTPVNPCGVNCRDVPDISANSGTPETFFVGGTWGAFVGTSVASPLVAGLVADTEGGCEAARRGIVAQALYGLVARGGSGTALSDVTSGDNDFTRTYNPPEYSAAPGYDPTTGLGTPIAQGWSCPQVFSVSPAQAQPGDEVTVSGANLQDATITFGGRRAQVVTTTPGSAVVVVPAGSGSVSVSASGLMGTGTSTGGFIFTAPATAPSVAPPPVSSGYDLVGQDGGVFVFPTNQPGGFFGSLPGLGIHVHDVAGMVSSPDDGGYLLVGQDGGVFSFGDAPFVGSLPGLHVAVGDIRGIVPTRDNSGYFLVGRDGGVFAFGDAPFLGSLPGERIRTSDIVGIAATPSDQGYWVVADDGTVYAFGNASNFGSATGTSSSVSAIASTPDGGGYWIVTQNGSVYGFGDAGYFFSLPLIGVTPTSPVIGLVPTADDQGYWLIGSDGGIFAFGDSPFVGSLPGLGIHITDIVGAVPTRP